MSIFCDFEIVMEISIKYIKCMSGSNRSISVSAATIMSQLLKFSQYMVNATKYFCGMTMVL